MILHVHKSITAKIYFKVISLGLVSRTSEKNQQLEILFLIIIWMFL